MTFSYYPGCTLKTKAKELDRYGRSAMKALGIELEELDNWQCCGGVYPIGKDELATKLSSVRTLENAKRNGGKLVTLCSACHNVLKQVNEEIRTNEDFALRANNYSKFDEEYHGETEVIHYLEVLRDTVGFDEIKKKVVKPFKNVKIGAYYGCLLLRPSKIMQMDNPENPKIIEDFIKAIGGVPVIYPYRNECCGGYVTLEDKKIAQKKSSAIMENAQSFGADLMVTACPLCQYNLTQNGGGSIPVKYFTELLAEALGVKEEN